MTANNENQTNSQRDPDDSGTPITSGSEPGRNVDNSSGQNASSGQKDEWIDDLGPDEFDDLEEGPATEMGKLPSPRAWDESVESSAAGTPPQRKTSSTFDDLPTFERKPDSSEARKILGEESSVSPGSAGAGPPDLSLIKPGFDEQEQSIHLDAAQLARLAYAIEETPAAASGAGVRHEGAMDAAQLAQLAFAIEDDPGRAAQASDVDAAQLASLAKAIQVTRDDANQPAAPMEPTNHQMKYTFDDLEPIDKSLLSGTTSPSSFAPPPGEDEGGENTLQLKREEDVEETLKTSPRTNNPLTNGGPPTLPLGVIDNEMASREQQEDVGEATLRLQRNDSQPPTQQLSPVLGQLIKRPTIDAGPSLDAEFFGSETLPPDSLQPGSFDSPLTDGSSGAPPTAAQVKTGFGRILNQRSGASQSQNQMPVHEPVTQGALPPLPVPGVVPQVPPTISQSQLPAQSPSGTLLDIAPPSMVPGQMAPSPPSALGAKSPTPGVAPPGALPPQPGTRSTGVPFAPTQPGAPFGAVPSVPPPGLQTSGQSLVPPSGPQMPASSAPTPGFQPSGQASVPPPGTQPSAAASPPPPAPGPTPFASQNPRSSATNIQPGPAPFGIPAPEHRSAPFNRPNLPAAGEAVVTGDVPPVAAKQPGMPQQPVVPQQPGVPQQPATQQSVPQQPQAELFPRPALGAPQQTSQVASGLSPANGDSTFEIPLLDREVAATASTEQDPSVVFFGKREAVLVRHAPPLSYKPSAKKATSQSYVELLTTKPQLQNRDVDDTTGENILVNNTPLVKISQGLSGAHPAQIPQTVPAEELLEPEPVEPGFNSPNVEILLSQASQKQLSIEPALQAGDSAPPPPTRPIDPPLQLERQRRDRPSNSRAGMPARGPVLLRGSVPDIQEGSQEQSIMPSAQGAVMPANRTPLILGGIVVVCMVVGLFAGSIFMSKKKEEAPLVGASSLTKPNNSDGTGAQEQLSLYKRAFAAEQQKDYTKALKFYSAGLSETPDDPELWSGRGRVLTHEGQFVRAESDIRKALELSPDNKTVLLDLAALFYYKKNYHEAVKQYNAIIKKQPDSSDAFFGRGLTLVWLNKRKEAIKDFQKVIALSPKHVLAYKQLAVEYMEAGDAKQAIKILDAGLLNAAESEELLFERALASYKLGKKEDAVEDYTKAIKLNSNRKDFFNDRGFVRLELRQYSGAIEDFKRALEIDPGYTIAQDNLARARKEQNE